MRGCEIVRSCARVCEYVCSCVMCVCGEGGGGGRVRDRVSYV